MLNWIDRAVLAIAPRAGVRRLQARAVAETIRAHYDGASTGRRTENWRAPQSSANAETRGQMPRLRARTRDLVRNNPWAARGVQVLASNVVGTGIEIVVDVPGRVSQARVRAMRDAWHQWSETTACDFDGRTTMAGLQSLAVRAMAEGGEALVVRRWQRGGMRVQVLEGDFLDTLRNGPTADGGHVIQGIEIDSQGRRVAYWLFDEHPGDGSRFGVGPPATTRFGASKRVPARDVIHVYRVDRPGQMRGVSWLAPVVVRLRDFADYEDAQLVRQKIAACFAAFVHDSPDAIETSTAPDRPLSDMLEPGTFEWLPPGKDIKFATPPKVDGYAEYARVTLTAIASALGITYEALTGDLTNVNFSSGRMGWLEFQRNLEQWRWQILIPQMCAGVWGWFAELYQLEDPGLAQSAVVDWTSPRREMINPSDELGAMRDAVRARLLTQSEALRQLGYRPEDVFDEAERDQAEMDRRGLISDTDPRRTTRAGGAVSAPEAPQPTNGGQ